MSNILLVPVHLDLLVLDDDQTVVEATANFSRLPFVTGKRDINPDVANISEEIVSTPFQNRNLRLKRPALQVEAYSEQKQEIGLLRMERLSAGVLLCLFAGEIARVDIHQKPETLHFGLDKSSQGSFTKSLRDPKGKKLEGKEVNVIAEHWRPNPSGIPDPSQRTLNVAVLAGSMKQELNPTAPPLTSAQFGLQMVEGVERIIFSRKSA